MDYEEEGGRPTEGASRAFPLASTYLEGHGSERATRKEEKSWAYVASVSVGRMEVAKIAAAGGAITKARARQRWSELRAGEGIARNAPGKLQRH